MVFQYLDVISAKEDPGAEGCVSNKQAVESQKWNLIDKDAPSPYHKVF